MKKTLTSLSLLLLVLALASCSQGPTAKMKLNFSLGYQTLLTTSKIRVLPVKTGDATPFGVFDINLANPMISIPAGNWTFYTVEWTGAAPYTGYMRCGVSSPFELKAGVEASIDITPSEANCGQAIFKTQFDNYCYEASTATSGVAGASIFRAGSGTVGDPYIICSFDQLNAIGQNFMNLSSSHFRLGKNLNAYGRFPTAASPTLANDPAPFTMIGQSLSTYSATPTIGFSGSFDGAGHSISGLSISFDDPTPKSHLGFIRYMTGGAIKNLFLYMPEVENSSTATVNYVGALIGQALPSYSPIAIENVHIYYGHVSASNFVGGFIGGTASEGSNGVSILASSYVEGDVGGGNYVGGFFGYKDSATAWAIKGSFTSGDIHSNSNNSSENMGGLIGGITSSNSSTPTIVASYSSMNIVGQTKIGGLIGSSMASMLAIQDSYSTGNLYAYGSGSYVGGIIGHATNGTLNRVFHTQGGIGSSSYSERGAIVGNASTGATCLAAYGTSQANLLPHCSGATMMNYTSMRNLSNYSSWTSSGTWVMDDNGYDFPRLAWEKPRPCHGLFSGSFAGGTGNPQDPYLICGREQFLRISNNPSASYALLSDIDFAETATRTESPLGALDFLGDLDGRFHSMNNLHISKTNYTGDFGLFRESFGSIANIRFNNYSIVNLWPHSPEESNTGVITGNNKGDITKVFLGKGNLKSLQGVTGGIAGTNSGSIRGCESEADIIAPRNIGGITGTNSGTILRSRSYSSVTASTTDPTYSIGGITGVNIGVISESQTNTYIFFSATTQITDVGGFVGYNEGSISDSFASGNIQISSIATLTNVAGFVGVNTLAASISRVWVNTVLSNSSGSTIPSSAQEFIGSNTGLNQFNDSYVLKTNSAWSTITPPYFVTAFTGMTFPLMSDYQRQGWSISNEDILDEENSPYTWKFEDGKMPTLIRTNMDRDGRSFTFYKNLLGF